jgi:hypothetical protein
MKVFEILRDDVQTVSEEQIKDRLSKFDWLYEYQSDSRKVSRGARELELLENLVYRLWKQNPDRAIQLWSEHCPGAAAGVVPSFIFRLENQDK